LELLVVSKKLGYENAARKDVCLSFQLSWNAVGNSDYIDPKEDELSYLNQRLQELQAAKDATEDMFANYCATKIEIRVRLFQSGGNKKAGEFLKELNVKNGVVPQQSPPSGNNVFEFNNTLLATLEAPHSCKYRCGVKAK